MDSERTMGTVKKQSLHPDHSRTAMILTHPGGQQLVFGLDWTPLVGINPHKQGIKQSRALRATHFVIAGVGARSLGMTRLKSKQAGRKSRMHSAAAHYAQKHSAGAFACLIPFEGHGCWMVASHAGAVLSNTDRWFSDLNAAYEAIEPIQTRFPFLQIQTEPTLTDQAMPSWLLEQLSPLSRLQPVKRLRKYFLIAIFLFSILGCIGIYSQKYLIHTSDMTRQEAPDARHEWQRALRRLDSQIPIHHYQSLLELTRTWHDVPVHPAGWKLRNIECEAAMPAWKCAAHFDRQHKFSLNSDLERHLPAQWIMHASPLESASWIWQVPHRQAPHDWVVASEPEDWMSYLQRISLAFDHIRIGTGAVLGVQAPLDSQGRVIPMPTELPIWRYRSFALKGPMRSVVMLEGLKVPVRWRRARLEIGSFSGQGPASHSALNLELTGELFETSKP